MIIFQARKPLSEKWMKAAVIGSLWATVEIIAGSLLHNLRIPLAGSILSFITVYLIISFFQLWKINGIIWRAGLICALMKSISPSAIILGPMLGILSEAFILEITIRTIGKNPVAYAIGGALAVFSALAQKAITLLILYGWDIVLLMENMVMFAARQLRFDTLQPSSLLIFISAIYLSGGALAGILGYQAGKAFIAKQAKGEYNVNINRKAESGLFKHSEKQRHSLPLLFSIFFLLITGMVVITYASIPMAALFSSLFTGLMIYRYKKSLGYLKKPAIWFQFVLILLFSTLFYNGFSFGWQWPNEGFTIGLKMIFRALVLLSGFSAISKELKNPVVKEILYHRGLKSLYRSLELAFSALPGIMEAFPDRLKGIRGFMKFNHIMLDSSQSLLDRFTSMEKDLPPIFVISGKVNEGKTARVKVIISELRKKGLKVSGFLSVGNTDDPGRSAYFVEDVSSGKKRLLCSRESATGSVKSGRFYFSEEGIDFGRNILIESTQSPADIIVIDELGPLEINDKGWAPAISELLSGSATPQLWVVRESLVKVMLRKWNTGKVHIFYLGTDSTALIADKITKYVIH